jgi:RHS repeat-associated protein
VPAGQAGTMTYDAAGNLTEDTYTGSGNRTYDGENKITSAMGANNQAQLYGYDASGQRLKRTVYGVETWQVYGFGGELLAEYAANGVPASPQKEYGYRNGQLLITATGTGALTNFALNKTATQSSTHSSGAVASRAVDGNTDGVFANGSVTHTNSDANGWWQVDLGQVQSLNTIKVWNRVEFPERLTSFYVFVSDVPFTSTNLTSTQNQAGVSSYYTTGQCGFPTEMAINRTGRYVRVQLAGTNFLSIAEVQVLGTAAPSNVALNKTATQSSTQSSGVPSRAVDGNTDGVYANNSVTHTTSELNAWWHVDLGQVETIATIKVWNRVEFPERLTNFYVFVSDVPFTSTNLNTTLNQAGVYSYQATGQCGFPTEVSINRTGRYVRVQLAGTNFLSIAEVQVWTGSSTPSIQWLISDHLGTPRMVLDQTGSLANMKRHDYLPFGEELIAPTSGRSAAQGYSGGDGVRQQFTAKERDTETGLDYYGARYYASLQGRFSGTDPIPVTKENFLNPQRWNLYSYVNNNPLCAVDPDGGQGQGKGGDKTISVFLDLGTEVGTRVTTYRNPDQIVKEPNASDWQGTKAAARGTGYNVDLQGSALTGEKGPPDVITNREFEESLAKSEVTIYIGHGVQADRDVLRMPFKQAGIKVGLTEYSASGTGNPLISAPPFTGPKPEVTASVVANFSCDSDRTGSSYFNFVGKNQYMVTVNSGKDGVTSSDAIEQAAHAFVKTYVATGGNVEKAKDAANAALAKN